LKRNLSALWRKLKKFFILPIGKKLILAEAFFMLGAGRFSVLLCPFDKIKMKVESNIAKLKHKYKLTKNANVLENTGSGKQLEDVFAVKWAVMVMSRYTPWKSNCFAQALAAHYMLGRRGLITSMHFGLAKKDTEEIAAHAWLLCNDIVVTGEREKKKFDTVLCIGC
jgi:hypothetical protein